MISPGDLLLPPELVLVREKESVWAVVTCHDGREGREEPLPYVVTVFVEPDGSLKSRKSGAAAVIRAEEEKRPGKWRLSSKKPQRRDSRELRAAEADAARRAKRLAACADAASHCLDEEELEEALRSIRHGMSQRQRRAAAAFLLASPDGPTEGDVRSAVRVLRHATAREVLKG